MIVTAQELIEAPRAIRPHVVLLGAGASRAAFPKGDANGRTLPLMNDLVSVVPQLRPLIDKADNEIGRHGNFEDIYSQLDARPGYIALKKEIERCIDKYFSSLSLPPRATIYDRLLISLRPTDAVFTFNWDPFLFDAHQRNFDAVPLPNIFFFHGNVRIGACHDHDKWGARNGLCSYCGRRFADVPLLYPIGKKNYSEDPYIRRSWEAAQTLFRDAFTMTIFGYSAPNSDIDAVELLQNAWMAQSERNLEHIEIINTADSSLLHDRWSPFTPTLHYQVTRSFDQSRIARWPRRSCEAVFYPMAEGRPCEDFPLPSTDSTIQLQKYAANIAKHEQT